MKLTKRIIALTIVLCTLGAMMIPSVSAEDDDPFLGVNFVDDFVKMGYTANTKFYQDPATYVADFNAHYNSTDPDEKIDWTVYTDAEGNVVTNAPKYSNMMTGSGQNGWQINFQSAAAATGNKQVFFALKFRAPGDGMFKLSMRFDNMSRLDKGGCYILEIPEGGYTAETLPVVAGEGTTNYVLPEEALAPLQTVYNNAGTPTAENTGSIWKGDFPTDLWPEYTPVALEGGEEYILVLWQRAIAEPTSTPYGIYSWFQLDYLGPIVEETVYEASIGDTQYETLAAAIEAANNAETDVTVKLLTNISYVANVDLNTNVTLDLNGKILDMTRYCALNGKITDDVGGGFLVCKNAANLVAPAGKFVMWDTDTEHFDKNTNGWSVWDYAFTSEGIKDTSKEGTTAKSFWVSMIFEDAAALDLIKANGYRADVGFEVQWIPTEGEAGAAKQYQFSSADMMLWAAEQQASDGKIGMYIDITGFEKIEGTGSLSVTPYVKIGNSAKTPFYGEAMTYPVG